MSAEDGSAGYTYWKSGLPDSGLVPERVDSPVDAAVPVAPGASAWNAGGTWEEKSVFQWADEFVRVRLDGAVLGGGAVVTAVEKVDGTASVVYVRQKKKPGFELNVAVKWTWVPDGHSVDEADDDVRVTGKLSLDEIAEHAMDDDDISSALSVTVAKRGSHPKSIDRDVKKAISAGAVPLFASLFADLLDGLHALS